MSISIIIPAYNAEGTLPECLESISDSQVEVIVVDDGSTDETAAVAEQFPGVQVISRRNGGVSAARNAGLAAAHGTYIVFVDADDTLQEGALSGLSAVLDSKPDIVVMRSFGSDSEKYPWTGLFPDGALCSKQDLVRNDWLRGSICGCAFRKGFLEESGLSFAEGVPLSEDLVFFSSCVCLAESILFKDIPFYQVRERPGSVSRTISPDYFRRYSLSLAAARERIPDPALYVAACRSIILGMIHLAIPAGYTPSRLYEEAKLDLVLPLPVVGRHPLEIAMLNRCFPLYFRLKHFRDLCRRP